MAAQVVESRRLTNSCRISIRLSADWQNGKRYYPYDGKRLAAVPANESLRPSAAVLAWHNEQVFRRAG